MRTIWVLCFLLPLLSGCLLGGISVFEPDPPRIESWIKPDTSAEQRVQDSIDCKGNENGDPVFSQVNIQEAMQPEDKDQWAARGRLYDNWERCMLNKGYKYIGKCYPDDSVSRSRPACGAP